MRSNGRLLVRWTPHPSRWRQLTPRAARRSGWYCCAVQTSAASSSTRTTTAGRPESWRPIPTPPFASTGPRSRNRFGLRVESNVCPRPSPTPISSHVLGGASLAPGLQSRAWSFPLARHSRSNTGPSNAVSKARRYPTAVLGRVPPGAEAHRILVRTSRSSSRSFELHA